MINGGFYDFKEIDIGYKRIVDITIKHENPNYIYALAYSLPFNDNYEKHIKSLEAAIIKFGNAKYIFLFAFKVAYAEINALWNAILKTEDIEYIRRFVLNVEDIKYDTLLSIAQEQGNEEVINLLNSYDIRLKKELQQGLYPYATEIVNNRLYRGNTLNRLIDSVTDKESLMKLKIYGEFLQKIDSIKEKLSSMDIDELKHEALELDEEYTGYVKKKNK